METSKKIVEYQRRDLRIRKTLLGKETVDFQGRVYDGNLICLELIQGEQRFLMNSLLPPGWRLIQSPIPVEYCSAPTEGKIMIREIFGDFGDGTTSDYYEMDLSVLTTLHEMGHAWWTDMLPPAEKVQLEAYLSSKDPSGDLLKKYSYENERMAWKYALKIRRELAQIGIDIEPNITAHQAIVWVEHCLDQYRDHYKRFGLDLKKEREEKFPIFRRNQPGVESA